MALYKFILIIVNCGSDECRFYVSFSLDADNLMESFDELTGKNERFWWEEENGYYGIMVRSDGNSQKIQ